MKNLSRIYILTATLSIFVGLGIMFGSFPIVKAQVKPISYGEIITALGSKLPNKSFKTKDQVINFLIDLVKESGVEEPLTADYEKLLRRAGATDGLIEVIRQKSLATPTPTPQTPTPSTPTPTPQVIVTPTNTPITTINQNPNIKVEKNSLGMEFVQIPAGTFMMGSPAAEVKRSFDETQHSVTITRAFLMGRYEVTQGQWKTVMGDNPSNNLKCGDNCPVEQVSWDDVQAFLVKLNAMGIGTYRLPTEAEWEYAARSGKSGEPFGIGDGKSMSSDIANFLADYPYGEGQKGIPNSKTIEVGSYPANSWGLFDMHGNVREWCSDWYFEKYEQDKPKDPKGPITPLNGSLKVYKGGGFSSAGDSLRSALRQRNTPTAKSSSVGFRLVKEL